MGNLNLFNPVLNELFEFNAKTIDGYFRHIKKDYTHFFIDEYKTQTTNLLVFQRTLSE